MTEHKRIRVVSGRVEEAPRPFSYSGGYSKAQGWTDIRVITLPPAAVSNAAYVYERGGTVASIGRKQAGAVLAFNASYVDTATGQLLGRTIAGGSVVSPNIVGKTESRKHLNFKDGRFGIGPAPTGVGWASQGSPVLRRGGKNVIAVQILAEKTGADIAKGDNPRMAAGIKPDGALVLVAVDGRGGGDAGLSLEELGYVFDWLKCPDAINLDGGGSATLYTNVPQLQEALGMKGDTKVCDIGAAGAARKVHHAVVLQFDIEALLPPKKNALLIIDPGHGGADPGGGSNDNFTEKDLVLEISLYQAERFRQLGVPVALTRTTDETLDPGPRTKRVRESGARFCISNHVNAGGGRGVETIHSLYNDGKLATVLCNAIASEGMPKRRVFNRALPSDPKKDYYFMHRETGAVTTVIVEYGFADDAEDTKRLQVNWERYAEAVVRAFCAYIDHPYVPPQSAPAEVDKTLPAVQRELAVTVNGAAAPAGYLINGVSYLPVRYLVEELLGGRIDGDGHAVNINFEELK